MRNPAGLLKSRSFILLTVAFLAQAAVVHSFSRGEIVPLASPLTALPNTFGSWTMVNETPLEKEVLDVLKADDTLSRTYVNGAKAANLFIAYFKSQRTGQTPHSPKNCLPGSGWVPVVDQKMTVDIPGLSQPIEVNHYIVQNSDSKSVVVYWYQSHRRVVASEYSAKFWVVADALRYNRTDTALIRVVLPAKDDADAATEAAVDFVRAFFDPVRQHLWQ